MSDQLQSESDLSGSDLSGSDPSGRGGRRMAPWIALGVAAVLAGLFAVLAGSGPATNEDGNDSYRIGRPAPRVVTETLDGQPFDLSRRKGSWVVINFFDSDCGPCVAEHPDLVSFVERQTASGSGVEFYSIIKGDSPEEVREFFATFGGSWPILTDDDGSISVAFGTAQVPETWIIDPSGVVVRRFAGQVNEQILTTALVDAQVEYQAP